MRMAMKIGVAVLGMVVAGGGVRGAFVNGVEGFDGTQLDLQTWAKSTANGATPITQNGALTIKGETLSNSQSFGGYETKGALVGVGGSVWAEVFVKPQTLGVFNPTNLLSLTTSTTGIVPDQGTYKSYEVVGSYGNGSFAITKQEVTQTNGQFTVFGGEGLTTPVLGKTYVYQIERLTDVDVRFSVFEELGPAAGGGVKIQLLGSGVQSSVQSSAAMFVLLGSAGLETTFDTVTLNRALALDQTVFIRPMAVPLPGAAGAGMVGLMGLAVGRAVRRWGKRS